MRIFKPTYPKTRTINGKRETVRRNGKIVYGQQRKWYVEYVDAQGRTRKKPGYTDKKATEQLAANLQRQVEREKVGIVDVAHEHLRTPVKQHIEDWLDERERAARSPEYVRKIRSRIKKMRLALGW